MKNRILEAKRKKKKLGLKVRFFLWFNRITCFSHLWEVTEKVGPTWDVTYGLKIKCKCKLCGSVKKIPNYKIEEVPDELVDYTIIYQ